ncbi:hypothetical protein HMPREF9554_01751 [Treponema phagedenis F0421]|nr:hypothetical protein HMPREF9554_01751 [Treponema phagedenis F0421]
MCIYISSQWILNFTGNRLDKEIELLKNFSERVFYYTISFDFLEKREKMQLLYQNLGFLLG